MIIRELVRSIKPQDESESRVELVSAEVVTVNGDGTLDIYMNADRDTVIPSVSKVDMGTAVTLIVGDICWALYVGGSILVLGREA